MNATKLVAATTMIALVAFAAAPTVAATTLDQAVSFCVTNLPPLGSEDDFRACMEEQCGADEPYIAVQKGDPGCTVQ